MGINTAYIYQLIKDGDLKKGFKKEKLISRTRRYKSD